MATVHTTTPWYRAKGTFFSISLPPVGWLILLFMLPLGIVWLMSFGEKRGIIDIAITGTLDNYIRAMEPIYLRIFAKSLWMATATTLFCLLIGFPVALAIVFAPKKLKPWLLLAIILPFWTNLLIRTYALIAVLRTRGYVNFTLAWFWDKADWFLTLIGLGHLQLLGDKYEPMVLLYNNFAVLFGLIFVALPFTVLPLYATLERMDRSYIEASLDLGAGQLRTFFKIILPLAMPGVISAVIITFIPTMGSFLTPDLLGGTDAILIANVIESQFLKANDWPFGAALAFNLMYLTFIALAFRAFFSRRGGAAREAG